MPIILDGWSQFFWISGDGKHKKGFPDYGMIIDLIHLPKLPYADKYDLEKFRIRPQLYDLDSQLLLRGRSNEIIDSFCDSETTYYKQVMVDFVNKNNLDKGILGVMMGVKYYCENIIPLWKPVTQKDRGFADLLIKSPKGKWKPNDRTFRNENKNLDWKHWDRDRREYDAINDRFPLYKEFDGTLKKIFGHLDNPINVSFGESRREISFHSGYNKRMGKLPKATRDRLNSVMSQCLFCYRFHVQEITKENKNRSRHCPLCKPQYDEWAEHIKNNRPDLNLRHIPILAF